MHTPQSLFDAVATHLLNQNAVSMHPDSDDAPRIGLGNGCAYRGEGGRKCAIGALIPDDKYDPEFEGSDVHCSAEIREAAGIPHKGLVLDLACRLQALHDNQPPCCWPALLHGIALRFNLDTSCLPHAEKEATK